MLPVRVLVQERRALYQRRKSSASSIDELRTEERQYSIRRWQAQWDAAEKGRWTFSLQRDNLETILNRTLHPETLVEAMLSSKATWDATSTFAMEVLKELRSIERQRYEDKGLCQIKFCQLTQCLQPFVNGSGREDIYIHGKCRLPELPCCGYYHCVDGFCTHPDYVPHVKFPVPTRNRTDDKLRRIFYCFVFKTSLWFYSQCISRVPITTCAFLAIIDKPVQFFLFCAVYGPCALILLGCYCYIYVVARYHARAIYTVELSLRQQDYSHTRYGQTLAITVGLFICLWMPFQILMLVDIVNGSSTLSGWTAIFLALPIFASSAVNPWVYGYRNSEVRSAVQRVLEELLGCIGFESPQYVCPELLGVNVHGDHAELNSFASHVRLCAVSPMRCTSLLLPPGGRTEVTELTNRDAEIAEDIPADLTVILQELNDKE
ncbi:uncharacterized protein LOC124354902 [Homalodisca vitripennis]|uniref:uncharacterized protein LOC124354902 n=1 Tax=Homalodisca vitripennis TaxID=197043 RepID=UPI001EEBB006|nr:uncharacterized protein LOC124354902 [Homalodisca vitripennis]